MPLTEAPSSRAINFAIESCCKLVTDFIRLIIKNIPFLKASFHAPWQNILLNSYPLPSLRVFNVSELSA